jgi:hypothetical protein
VANDAGSVYSPAPSLGLTFHPYSPPNDADPTLADTNTTLLEPQTVQSQVIHQYVPADGTSPSTFFRFIYEVPLQDVEMTVKYRLNGGPALSFVIPAKDQNLRWAAHSCNGKLSMRRRSDHADKQDSRPVSTQMNSRDSTNQVTIPCGKIWFFATIPKHCTVWLEVVIRYTVMPLLESPSYRVRAPFM